MRKWDKQEAQNKGELAAARELRRLHVDLTRAVDIFKIIMESQLWLMFQPLDGPLGVHLPGGILINSKRRLGIQRLTAAHEYGHYLLDHHISVDNESNIISQQSLRNMKEVEARAFAADFLMPVQLVAYLWKHLALPDSVGAYHAYLLSLHMGTSYQATIYQLIAQERVSPADGERLLKTPPRRVKKDIAGGSTPQNSWADIWPIGKDDSGTKIHIGIDDEIRIQLPESPTTGYIWSVDLRHVVDQTSGMPNAHDIGADALLSLVRSEFDPLESQLTRSGTGGYGNRYMTFRALRHGDVDLRLPLARPWLNNASPLDVFTLGVHVTETAAGLPQPVQQALLAA